MRYVAIREAVANAVAHRDYALQGDEVRVAIFDDRIEVQSPGLLPRPLTLRGLGQEHVLRNRRLAQLLFNIRYIENWNTGIHRMRAAMRAHGLSEPAFEELGHSFVVRFTGPGDRILDLVPEDGVTDLQMVGLNERQVEALRLMVNEREEMSNERYRSLFGVAARTALRDLEGLVERRLAVRRGTRRSTRYVARVSSAGVRRSSTAYNAPKWRIAWRIKFAGTGELTKEPVDESDRLADRRLERAGLAS